MLLAEGDQNQIIEIIFRIVNLQEVTSVHKYN